MKITIITPSYNQGQFIEETILSVLNQSNADVEHIVVDGGSTDDTVEVLKKYPSVRWVSEKDEGQADALQKGLEMATGEIIGWINSDDYLEPNILEFVSDYFEKENVDWIIGDISLVYDEEQTIVPIKSPKITTKTLFSNPDNIRQQGAFFRKQSLLKAGGFDKKFQLTMDLDLWFRMLKLSDPVMVDRNLAYFRWHKGQKTSAKVISKQKVEILNVLKKNNASLYYRNKLIFRKFILSQTSRAGSFKKKMRKKDV